MTRTGKPDRRQYNDGSTYGLPASRRFWMKVSGVGADSCWEWTGGRDFKGYGMFQEATKKTVRAHVYAYRTVRGPIPRGMQIDHLCRNTGCANPWHMEVVTLAENRRRQRVALGHTPLSPTELESMRARNARRRAARLGEQVAA